MPTGARLARTDDVDAITGITLATWRERLPDRVLQSSDMPLDADSIARQWADALLRPPSPLHRLAVAVDDQDRVCGYAAWAPAQGRDAEVAHVEVVAFEVDPAVRGRGHGSRLMSAVVDLCASQGADSLAHWCPVDDERRRTFFVDAGWGPDSAWRDLQVGDDLRAREVRLVTALG